MAGTCGVCSEQESKYKCPHCELQYCGVKCFKAHITTHEDDEVSAEKPPTSTNSTQQLDVPAPTTTSIVAPQPPTLPQAPEPEDENHKLFAAVKDDPRLAYLFQAYPGLQQKLRHIFELNQRLTKPPLEGRPGDLQTKPSHNNWVRRHGKAGNASFYRRDQWTQEKADRGALRRLGEMADRDQSVREFIYLCDMIMEEKKQGEK